MFIYYQILIQEHEKPSNITLLDTNKINETVLLLLFYNSQRSFNISVVGVKFHTLKKNKPMQIECVLYFCNHEDGFHFMGKHNIRSTCSSPPVFILVLFSQSLVLCLVYCGSFIVLMSFLLAIVLCSSSTYCFWLPSLVSSNFSKKKKKECKHLTFYIFAVTKQLSF